MIEWVGQALRWLHLLSGACALGGFWWLLQIELGTDNYKFVRRSFAFLLFLFVISGLALMIRQAGVASGSAALGNGIEETIRFASSTQFGQIWLARIAVALLTLGIFLAAGGRAALLLFIAFGMLQFSLAFAGHGAATDAPALSIIAHGIHVAAASLWLGGLAYLAFFVCRSASDGNHIASAMRKFSELALNSMILVVMSGIIIATLQIRSWPALFGTTYGERLLLKLLILLGVFVIAGHLRWRVLNSIGARLTNKKARSRIALTLGIEILLGLSILWLAASLAVTPPAQHEQITWPFNSRIAEQVTWLKPDVRAQFWWGMLILGIGLAGLVWIRRRIAKEWHLAILSLTLVGLGLWAAISPLTLPAFPDSYRRSAVPYHVLSIANGKDLYANHCVGCHGVDATGNGPLAEGSTKRPADLTAPHLGDHTPGDLYWWLTHGIAGTAMPAFSNLSEEERWDMVNFLHVLASGYEARVLRQRVIPERPWLGAPDFNFVAKDGTSGSLRDFRENAVVLLVLSNEQSTARLNQLNQMVSAAEKSKLKIIVVPINNSVIKLDNPNVVVVTDGNREIAASYVLFRRTIENPRSGEQGALPTHMEFLIDRFGYVRARWLPEDTRPGWGDVNVLMAQIEMLSREPRTRPPPDEHLH
jgi:copper resistance protein D